MTAGNSASPAKPEEPVEPVEPVLPLSPVVPPPSASTAEVHHYLRLCFHDRLQLAPEERAVLLDGQVVHGLSDEGLDLIFGPVRLGVAMTHAVHDFYDPVSSRRAGVDV